MTQKKPRLSLLVLPIETFHYHIFEYLERPDFVRFRQLNKDCKLLFETSKKSLPYRSFFQFLRKKNDNTLNSPNMEETERDRLKNRRKSLIHQLDSFIELLQRLRNTIEAQDELVSKVEMIERERKKERRWGKPPKLSEIPYIERYILRTPNIRNELRSLANELSVNFLTPEENTCAPDNPHWTRGPPDYFSYKSIKIEFSLSKKVLLHVYCEDRTEYDETNCSLRIKVKFSGRSNYVSLFDEDSESCRDLYDWLVKRRNYDCKVPESDRIDELVRKMHEKTARRMKRVLCLKELSLVDFKRVLFVLSSVFFKKANIGY